MITFVFGVAFFLIAALAVFLHRLYYRFGANPKGDRLERIKKSPHYVKGRFRNLVDTPMRGPDGDFRKVFKEMIFRKKGRVPDGELNSATITNVETEHAYSARWMGHSTVFIRMAGLNILVDPVFSDRASPVSFMGPKAFPGSIRMTAEMFPGLDVLLISHDHYDHLDVKAVKVLRSQVKKVVCPLGVGCHLEKWGVPAHKIIELDWNDIFTIEAGKPAAAEYPLASGNPKLTFTALPSRHFSGRRGGNRNSTLWASFMLDDGNKKIYFGSDSGYGDHFREIGERFGPVDLAMLECGAYSKYWPYIHMFPEQTFQATLDLQAKSLLPIHHSKFNLSIHPWQEPVERLKAASDDRIRLVLPGIGEEFVLGVDP